MISWPAAKEMRWVNPSIATVSPSRTNSRTASAIDATFDGAIELAGGLHPADRARRLGRVEDRLVGTLAGNLCDGLAEDPQRRRHLGLADDQRRRHPDRRPAALEHEQAALEGGP